MPLAASRRNPRYFADPTDGRCVLLTGTHTWNDLQETGDSRRRFDFDAYLDFLVRHDMNIIRLWTWEHPRWGPWSSDDGWRIDPSCWTRTGPGAARDGMPKFDLDRPNDAFLDRLHDRVARAGKRGIFASVMLFCGCSIGNRGWPARDAASGLPVRNPWDSHPFNRANNINGIDGDPGGRGDGWDTRRIDRPEILDHQLAWVRAVSDRLDGLDNALFEVSNEDPFDTGPWQHLIVKALQEYERLRGRCRPVGMSCSWNQPNTALFQGTADWVSPAYDESAATVPHEASGNAVWIADSDHVFPNVGITVDFAWKAFCRGANIISMDHRKTGEAWTYFLGKACDAVRRIEAVEPRSLSAGDFTSGPGDLAQRAIRRAANRIDLGGAEVRSNLCSTGYCLADEGRTYLAYQPDAGEITLDLSRASGTLAVSWMDTISGEVVATGSLEGGDPEASLRPPVSPIALILERGGTA